MTTKMHSETADVAPGAATWQTEQNIHVVFGLLSALYENLTSSTKPEIIIYYRIAIRGSMTEPGPQITSAENLDVWFSRYESEQTDTHTDTLITILCTHTGGGETITGGLARFTNRRPCRVLLLTTMHSQCLYVDMPGLLRWPRLAESVM